MKDIRFICNVWEIYIKKKNPDFQAMTFRMYRFGKMVILFNGRDTVLYWKAI